MNSTNTETGTLDPCVPNGLQMVNHLAGQEINRQVDEVLAADLARLVGGLGAAVHAAGEFKTGVVRRAVRMGVRQIIDLGCGIPRLPHIYQRAHDLDPSALVVSVETDVWAVAHARAELDATHLTPVITAPYLTADILDHPVLHDRVDWRHPVCVLLVSSPHTAALRDLAGLVAAIVSRLPQGSLLAVSQWAIDDDMTRWAVNGLLAERTRGWWGQVRSSAEIVAALTPHPLLGPPPGPVARRAWSAKRQHPAPGGGQLAKVVEFGGIIHLGGPALPAVHQDVS
ncbi:SAM-dependent methyltransferase [Kitasatospora sp. NPDC088160]|uniref:SAM-dependent methyltransferase n=1 Tax=Kitasatospora sp. NPDC088160 TaxID=3364072 RepID=UPI00380A15C9